MTIIHSPSPFPLPQVHNLLRQTDWAQDRPEELTVRAMAGSLCFGVMNDEGQLVAFARVVTDGAIFGYLADVVVDEAHRRQGVGKKLMEGIMAHPTVASFIRFALVNQDLQEFYSPFGFVACDKTVGWMQIFNKPDYVTVH